MPLTNFKRIEKKFWLTEQQYQAVMTYLQDKTDLDSFGEVDICNIYYDTPFYSLIRKSITRPLFKEKIRLRSYGFPKQDSLVFVELKRKYNGIGYKRRVQIPYRSAVELLSSQREPNGQIEKEIAEFVHRYPIEPKVMLSYHRIPLVLKADSDFRITFDSRLRYKPYQEGMSFDDKGDSIMEDESKILMEIKTSTAIPQEFLEVLNTNKIYQAPFSKIGACYSRHLYKEIKTC